MVDEDPHSSHHKLRDTMFLVRASDDLELRRRDQRHLIVVKPDLERCFLRSMKRVGLESSLPEDPEQLQAILNLPNHPKHDVFRSELAELRDASRARNIGTLMTRLEDELRAFAEADP